MLRLQDEADRLGLAPYGTEPQTSPISRPRTGATLPRERFSPSTLQRR
jgi:hypothetical protein